MPFNNNDQAASLRKANVKPPDIQSKKAICCLTVASGKGGVGKTFLSVNLSLAFKKLNKKVLLVDADLGLANADIVFGVHPEYTLQDAIFKGKSLEEVVVHTDYGVDLLSASSGSKEMVSLGQARMKMFIKDLISFAGNYDVLIFDCAAGIDSNVTSFIAATPQSIIVATPQPTSLMDVYALIKLIHQDKLTENIGIVVNMAEFEEQGQKAAATLKGVAQKFLSKSFDLLGIIPDSPYAHKAIRMRKPLLASHEDDSAAIKIKEICKSILQKQHGMTKLDRIDGEKLAAGMLNI